MQVIKKTEFYVFLVIVALLLIIRFFNASIFSSESFSDILRTSSIPGILAIGVFVVMLSGGVDMSFGALAMLAAYISGEFAIIFGGNIFSTLAIGALVGVALGSFNGIIISKFKVPTIIVTLGTYAIFKSSMVLITGAVWVYKIPKWFISFGRLHILGLSIGSYIYIFLLLLTYLI